MTLTFIGGGIGSGKSLLATYLAIKEAQRGKYVITNWRIKDKRIHMINKDRLFELREKPNGVLFIDEASTYIDSRNFTSLQNRIITHILKQSRKAGLDVYLIDNLFSAIDIRARRLVQVLIIASHPSQDTFIYTKIDLERGTESKFMLSPDLARKIYKLYNTHEEIGLKDLFMSKKKEKELKRKIIYGE